MILLFKMQNELNYQWLIISTNEDKRCLIYQELWDCELLNFFMTISNFEWFQLLLNILYEISQSYPRISLKIPWFPIVQKFLPQYFTILKKLIYSKLFHIIQKRTVVFWIAFCPWSYNIAYCFLFNFYLHMDEHSHSIWFLFFRFFWYYQSQRAPILFDLILNTKHLQFLLSLYISDFNYFILP